MTALPSPALAALLIAAGVALTLAAFGLGHAAHWAWSRLRNPPRWERSGENVWRAQWRGCALRVEWTPALDDARVPWLAYVSGGRAGLPTAYLRARSLREAQRLAERDARGRWKAWLRWRGGVA